MGTYLSRKLAEAERKQAQDQEQCDEMTSQTAQMAVELKEAQLQVAGLREAIERSRVHSTVANIYEVLDEALTSSAKLGERVLAEARKPLEDALRECIPAKAKGRKHPRYAEWEQKYGDAAQYQEEWGIFHCWLAITVLKDAALASSAEIGEQVKKDAVAEYILSQPTYAKKEDELADVRAEARKPLEDALKEVRKLAKEWLEHRTVSHRSGGPCSGYVDIPSKAGLAIRNSGAELLDLLDALAGPEKEEE